MVRATGVAVSLALALTMPACGGRQGDAGSPGTGAAPASSAGDAGAEASAPAPRPFASTPLEAQSLIQEQIDGRMNVLWKCVADYRTKNRDPHKPLAVDIGIDQEGTLLGVASPNPKKELDPTLHDCMMAALHGLPFPRSHAGIITVRQTFKDQQVQGP
jgi:hypothetical protein